MSEYKSISDEQLNAYIDNELDSSERARVLAAIQSNKELEAKYNKLCQMKDMVALAYDRVPKPAVSHRNVATSQVPYWKLGTAASIILTVGLVIGWLAGNSQVIDPEKSFLLVSQLESKTNTNPKVLLHISTMDSKRIEMALDKAESLLRDSKNEHKPIEVEIIANSQGLGLLRSNSPYARRVKSLTSEYNNVSFLACGIARENARMKEGRDIELLPEATQVPAALDQILKRLKLGWLYVRA